MSLTSIHSLDDLEKFLSPPHEPPLSIDLALLRKLIDHERTRVDAGLADATLLNELIALDKHLVVDHDAVSGAVE